MRRGGLLLLLLSSLLLQDGAVARGTELERLTVGYTAIASPQAPAWVAHDLGSFRQHGLDVQLRYIESGRLGVAALVARELPVLVLAATAAIQAALGGADVVLIAGLTNILAYRVVTVPEITRPEELRGKKLGILRPGDITESAFRRVLRHYGIPPTEVSFLQRAQGPARHLDAQHRLPDDQRGHDPDLHPGAPGDPPEVHQRARPRDRALQAPEGREPRGDQPVHADHGPGGAGGGLSSLRCAHPPAQALPHAQGDPGDPRRPGGLQPQGSGGPARGLRR
ncbi:MAG: ABC transporter substrate-binding protein [Deltaproteobacteria bacterium]|nr:ABC transporter substrate-binding protein [Deltaproteobacteria bacterium]